ncbi:MAG: GTPase HflX [Ignavibacteriales bacterium]|nr:GTPase HflX [Ignavibacteriaceae bacterium]QOJ27705.1 MAG: GTPase HflX [Ignavibacteriales bacterium]
MIELQKDPFEKAVLVALKTSRVTRDTVDEHLDELEELALTAGAVAVKKFIQDRSGYDSAYFIGTGKVEEIKQYVEDNNINLVIFDDDLSPVQLRNLEKAINKKIVDRSALILDIFAKHASTNEAKTQVELAQLLYYLPRLTRQWTHLSKQYAGVGTKGPGETQIETDRRLVRDRIAMLRQRLKKIEGQRETQTARRKELLRISLVGYTNAGKSTLFNLLTGAGILAEDKLFATLDSTTRTLQLENSVNAIISDTVGFIRKLPHHLVASFRSTLREVREADIILHIIDASHPFFEDHIQVVDETLKSLECNTKPVIKVFNKIDKLDNTAELEYIRQNFDLSVSLSAATGLNVHALIEMISSLATSGFAEETVTLPIEKSFLIARIRNIADILEETYLDTGVTLRYRVSNANLEIARNILHG